LFISIGGQKSDRRFGLPLPDVAGRIAWLDEMLGAIRTLWLGQEVSMSGRFVTLDRARVTAAMTTPPPIEVGARSPRLLGVAAAHADAWNVNLPPLAGLLQPARQALAAACRERGRPVGSVALRCPVFVRPGEDPADPALLASYRRFNPWFGAIQDAELLPAIVAGSAADCRARLTTLREELQLELPILDLTGLPRDAARRALDALAPG
jgi:alkanesulfonate monooxygenase SsuD/methylene tetrahydromethanopterin reductase-like flavin-dependent oxidoreductase (luciferase family)